MKNVIKKRERETEQNEDVEIKNKIIEIGTSMAALEGNAGMCPQARPYRVEDRMS